ncbi:hypothetical protein MHI39_24190 [Heyndrickxia sp. FSL K6-6286]|jgi:hypothetical protein
MKKVLVSFTLGALLFGGIIYSNGSVKNIAAGGEKEPSVLSTRSIIA